MDEKGTDLRPPYLLIANVYLAYSLLRPAMPHRIPVEIIEENIVDAIAHSRDIKTLCSIALACRRLLLAVRQRPTFFLRIKIEPGQYYALLDFVQRHAFVRDTIQSFSLGCPWIPKSRVTIPISLLILLPSLRQLTWWDLGRELSSIHPGMLLGIRSHATHINTLNFYRVHFLSGPEFARFLLAFRGLLHLCLSEVDVIENIALAEHLKIRLSHRLCLLSLKASTSHTPFCKHSIMLTELAIFTVGLWCEGGDQGRSFPYVFR